MESVRMVLKSSGDWSKIEYANELASILASAGDFILPEKYDQYEPERFTFDIEDPTKLHEFWTSTTSCVLFKRKKPYLSWLNLTISRGKRFNEILSAFDARYFKEEDELEKLISFGKRLYKWGSIDHGYICHQKDWEIKNKFEKPVMIKGRPVMTGGVWLRESLPGIYWANFFGPVYMELLGKESFSSLTVYRKEELADGGYVVITARTPFDYNQPEMQKKEKEILNHLGDDIFFDRLNPTKECRIPDLIKDHANG